MQCKPTLNAVLLGLRLAVLMVMGVFVGFTCIGDLLIGWFYRYAHSGMEAIVCEFEGAFVGAGLGLLAHGVLAPWFLRVNRDVREATAKWK